VRTVGCETPHICQLRRAELGNTVQLRPHFIGKWVNNRPATQLLQFFSRTFRKKVTWNSEKIKNNQEQVLKLD